MASCKEQDNKRTKTADQFDSQRESMVQTQIFSRGVKDKNVLEAMRKVPRHKFVPNNVKDLAYIDDPLPIGEEQTISQPYIVAYMTEQLELKKEDKVLEIGTGSGYQAAILAEIVDSVFTIEIVDVLAKRAQNTLQDLNYKNVYVKSGDGYQGWKEHAPFDAIIITAAPPRIPKPLIEQLKIGGKMILPVGKIFQELVLVTKTETGIKKKKLLPVRFVPMTGEIQKN
ncbi:protein-L-isoaspartate(D-aspartate) O-methyltransferase [Calditrichota bacterium]